MDFRTLQRLTGRPGLQHLGLRPKIFSLLEPHFGVTRERLFDARVVGYIKCGWWGTASRSCCRPPGASRQVMSDQLLILVVEDEALIAMEAEDTLKSGGYEVLVARNGDAALEVIQQRGVELAGLVTDIRWNTGPDGWQVAMSAREANRTIPVVYMTADSADDWPVKGVPKSIMLHKPFAPVQLLTALANLQNEQDSSLV